VGSSGVYAAHGLGLFRGRGLRPKKGHRGE
jgi:hypothetical protein